MATIYMMRAASLFCGDDDPTKGKGIQLDELKLPPIQGIYQEHHGGGSVFQVEFEMGFQKLEPTFKLAGWNPDVDAKIAIASAQSTNFTAYGVIVDRQTSRKIEAKAVIRGRLGKIESDAFKRGDKQSHDYAINEVTHYELFFDKSELFYMDFFENVVRVNGVEQYAEDNAILRLR